MRVVSAHLPDRATPFPRSMIGAAVAVCLAAAAAFGADKPAPSAPAPSAAIPVAEVAARSAEVQSLLPTLALPLTPDPELQRVIEQVPDFDRQIQVEMGELESTLEQQPALGTLAAQRQAWADRRFKISRALSLLTQWVTNLDTSLEQLQQLQATWRDTENAAKAAKAPAAILQLITTVRTGITHTHGPFDDQRKIALTLQGQVAQQVAQCDTALQMLQQAQQQAVGGTLARESAPIWSNALWTSSAGNFASALRETSARRSQMFRQYVRGTLSNLQFPLSILALFVLLSGARRLSRWRGPSASDVVAAERVLQYPGAATCVVALVYASMPGTPVTAPPAFRQLFVVLGLLPALRLVRDRLDGRWLRLVYLGIAVFAVDAFRQAYVGIAGLEQAVLLFELLSALFLLWSACDMGALGVAVPQPAPKPRFRGWATVVLVAVAVGLIGAAFGYMRLARLIASAILGSGAWALTLYAGARVMLGLFAVSLDCIPLNRLRMVQRHRGLLLRRARLTIAWISVAAWALRSLDYVGLYQPVSAVVLNIVTAKVERGALSISVGDVLLFGATLAVAYALSRFVRFALEEDIYPRMPISRGVSYAFSTLLNYLIIALGFLAAVGALGVDLTKITIIAGALGVGIGLGLQGVVTNLVSGLILLFEQSIQVGDSVEVDGVSGQVSRIGIRSSIVRTWQGAEVVVPNSLLVTQKLTNWTLSDRLRRIDMPVNINYGTPPEQVIPLLKAVAVAHPRVLADPAPDAVFLGFGESGVNYELRAWTDRDSMLLQTRNELASAVYQAVHTAGMAFPFPQREIRVVNDGRPESASVPDRPPAGKTS